MNSENLIPVKEEDFLDQDPPLRGQNFVCLSFLSPEEILKQKDVYFFEQFLTEFSKDMIEFFDKLGEKYKEDIDVLKMIKDRYSYIFESKSLQEEYQYFTNSRSAELEALFHEKNNFQTSIRGLKVRGVFDSMKEAEVRSQVLKRMDNKFNVYVAQVGCWCPWSPNPDDITDQEYAETNLNTLMKNYKENQDKKDMFFEERKRDLQFLKTKEKLEEKDNWLANKENEILVSESVSIINDVADIATDSSADVADIATDSSADESIDSLKLIVSADESIDSVKLIVSVDEIVLSVKEPIDLEKIEVDVDKIVVAVDEIIVSTNLSDRVVNKQLSLP
jgi:hypothetical protein